MINDHCYVDESASGQNEANPVFWLANRMGKIGPSDLSHLVFPEMVLQDKINFLWTNLVRSRWLDIDLVLFCIFIDLRNFASVYKNAKKKKKKDNIQSSWPHTCSITHINCIVQTRFYIKAKSCNYRHFQLSTQNIIRSTGTKTSWSRSTVTQWDER